MTGNLLAENLQVCLGKKEVIHQVSFSCRPGLIGLLGKNGAGKTTLLKALLRLEYRQRGKVSLQYDGKGESAKEISLSDLSGRRRASYLSYVPQELSAPFSCSVLDFVVMGRTPYLHLLQNPAKADYQVAKEALQSLGISYLADCYMDSISGGERKLAYLARAGAQKAEWMLLDEPTAGLDFGRQHQFLEVLTGYLHKNGLGAIVSIHDPVLAYLYCDTILVLKEGSLAAQLNREDTFFEEEYGRQLSSLYGKEAVFADTPAGKTIVWRREEYA